MKIYFRFFVSYAVGGTLGTFLGSLLFWPDHWIFSLAVWLGSMIASAVLAWIDLKEWKRDGPSYLD